MIKAIIQKELRENYKLALAGAAIFGVLISINFDHFNPPLVQDGFEVTASFFCGIFGALLGFLQIRRENHPDLRAFLIHRPLSRTGIILGKVIAGLALYLLAAGLPLVCLIILVQVPDRVAAPFDWAMTLPAAAAFLAGVVCYFAGMIARQPQARWPVTRALALGAGILTLAWPYREFWQTLVLIIISGAVLGAAAWGSFVSHGGSRRGSAAAGTALPVALLPGMVMLLILGVSAFIALVIRPNENRQDYGTLMYYKVFADGTVAKYSQSANRGVSLTDTNGVFLKDPKTGKYLPPDRLDQFTAPAAHPMTLPEAGTGHPDPFRDFQRFYRQVFRGRQTMWYYSFPRGRLLGYDLVSSEFVGSVGPDGLASNSPATVQRFSPRSGTDLYQTPSTLADGHTIFQSVLPGNGEVPTIKPLFSVPADDILVATADISSNTFPQNVSVISGPNVIRVGMTSTWVATAAVTSRYVYVISKEGTVLWKVPRPAAFSGDASLEICLVNELDQCVLMVTPSNTANDRAGGKLPTHLEFYDRNSSLVRTLDLPTSVQTDPALSLQAKCVALLLPCVASPLGGSLGMHVPPSNLLLAALCAIVAFLIGLRARLSVRAQIGWFIFLLLTGVSGFLIFLCLQSWPARERCPNCKKLRVVNRDRCEHCAAAFAPADKNGTEIFEPLGSV